MKIFYKGNYILPTGNGKPLKGFNSPIIIAEYKFNSSINTFPTFNEGYTYSYFDIDNGDGTTTRTIYTTHIPTSINFIGCTGLLEVNKLDIRGINSARGLFRQCSNLTKVESSDWDTSNITDMYTLFYACPN